MLLYRSKRPIYLPRPRTTGARKRGDDVLVHSYARQLQLLSRGDELSKWKFKGVIETQRRPTGSTLTIPLDFTVSYISYLLQCLFATMDFLRPGFSPLASLIRDQISRCGPVPFPWFMEQALYHVQYGYYSGPRSRIGKEGDFYTNISTGTTFGQILAAQIVEMWSALGKPS